MVDNSGDPIYDPEPKEAPEGPGQDDRFDGFYPTHIFFVSKKGDQDFLFRDNIFEENLVNMYVTYQDPFFFPSLRLSTLRC